MASITWTLRAVDDLIDMGSARERAAVKRAVDRLARFPDYGMPTDEPDVRVIVVPRSHYRVVYRRLPTAAEILRIEDARRSGPLRPR